MARQYGQHGAKFDFCVQPDTGFGFIPSSSSSAADVTELRDFVEARTGRAAQGA